jgi:putative nucleotidyltransferase with HDIG domain
MKAEESKDPYTYGHSDRVTKLALAIAERMNQDDNFKKIISRAGLLHDIGKIGIQDAVLLKQEKLTDAEWEIIKSHSQQGAKILEPLKFLAQERKIILHHHERYDGKGYPDRLMGEEIPLGSLILAVADAFDAMNSQRPYRQAMERVAIIAELSRCRGTQHKAQITDTLLKLLEERPELWDK